MNPFEKRGDSSDVPVLGARWLMAVLQCLTAAKETGVAGTWMNLTVSSDGCS
jgi:hypothetical protein